MIAVKINAGDKDRPILFGSYAIREYAHLENITYDEALSKMDTMNTEQVMRMFYCGFLYGAKKEKQDIDFTEDDVWFWLDDDAKLLDKVMDVFAKSWPDGKEIKKRTRKLG